jgi:hypothetical protein
MTTKISRWCSCGASCSITVANQDAPVARLVIDEFNAIHHGPEHRPTDAAGAAQGRRRAERQRAAEERKERALW